MVYIYRGVMLVESGNRGGRQGLCVCVVDRCVFFGWWDLGVCDVRCEGRFVSTYTVFASSMKIEVVQTDQKLIDELNFSYLF